MLYPLSYGGHTLHLSHRVATVSSGPSDNSPRRPTRQTHPQQYSGWARAPTSLIKAAARPVAALPLGGIAAHVPSWEALLPMCVPMSISAPASVSYPRPRPRPCPALPVPVLGVRPWWVPSRPVLSGMAERVIRLPMVEWSTK